jgi:GGDEF domain-containing protein
LLKEIEPMLKKPGQLLPARQPLRLMAAPSIGEIDQFFAEVMRQTGTKLQLCWPNSDKSADYLLSAYIGKNGGEAQWEFFSGSGKNQQPLWTYVTSDILLVTNLIASSTMQAEYKNAATGKRIKANDGYGDIYQIPDTYYRTALDLMAKEQQKISMLNQSTLNRQPVTSVLSGDLAQVDISNVIQAISHSRMTGRLNIVTPTGNGEVYFVNGVPVHAKSGGLQGDECLLTMMICRHGNFRFDPDIEAEKKTVRQKTDVLMLKGVLLRDKAQFLNNSGLQLDSVVKRKREDLAEAEFEAVSSSVASGSHLEFSMFAQKQFYLAIDNRATVGELVDKLQLTESQWIPLMCRMIKCDFVELVNADPTHGPLPLERKIVDRQAIYSVMMSLRRPESGMYTFPAFLYFLEQESIRSLRSNKSLSIAIVEMRISGPHYEYRSPLPANILGECVRRISTIKRDADLLGHYEIFDAAVILPDTNNKGAKTFASRIIEAMRERPLTNETGAEIFIAVGTATMPEDVGDMGFLLAAAEAAKNAAQRTTDGVVSFHDIKEK